MDIEILIHDEINNYKEKIYFLNLRQWIFSILIVSIVVPLYIFLKDKINEEIVSYLVICIAGILGFIGFVQIHELPVEKLILYWYRNYMLFRKEIEYITEMDFQNQNDKKIKKAKRKEKKKQKILEKAKRKYISKEKQKKGKVQDINNIEDNKKIEGDTLNLKLDNLTEEEQALLLKLIRK